MLKLTNLDTLRKNIKLYVRIEKINYVINKNIYNSRYSQ